MNSGGSGGLRICGEPDSRHLGFRNEGAHRMKYIKDGRNKLIGQIVENGAVTYIRDGQGRPKGIYTKATDVTHDERGKFVG